MMHVPIYIRFISVLLAFEFYIIHDKLSSDERVTGSKMTWYQVTSG
jgi:hypothetical protein